MERDARSPRGIFQLCIAVFPGADALCGCIPGGHFWLAAALSTTQLGGVHVDPTDIPAAYDGLGREDLYLWPAAGHESLFGGCVRRLGGGVVRPGNRGHLPAG